jgi:probable HAF family extracellular repeat protein
MASSFRLIKLLHIAGIIGALHTSNSQAQSMNDLGTLGGTAINQDWSPITVSANGDVIFSTSYLASGATHSFKYSGSTVTDLGTLGGTLSSANAMSANGSVIVGISTLADDSTMHAFKYSGSTMTDLGTFGGTYSSANAVSADGSVIVGFSYFNANANVHAFKYVGSTMTDLLTLGGTNSSATAVSADGLVIVGQSTLADETVTHAFKYVGSTMTDLGNFGGTYTSANAVSADGSVIVGFSFLNANANFHAFKYSGSTMTDLGTLGGAFSSATSVSADGLVIVGRSTLTGDTVTHAFKYVGNTMTDLGTLGGTSSQAQGVSADGKVIVGYSSIAGDAVAHAFVYGAWANGGLVDVNNTYSALSTNSYQLNSLLNAQNTALAVNLNSDCTVYGANNVCVGVGGRYTNVSSPTSTQTAGNIQVGYRFAPSFRAGVFLDQGISNATPNNYTVKNSQPLAGLFAVYAPSGTNLGLQVKASAAYSSNGVNITRTTLANTEAGQGTSTMTTQGAQLESAYGFAVGDSWVASPLAGIRATSVVRNGYTETAGATFPITYNPVTQSATTAYAGAKVMGYVTPTVSVGTSVGVEQDLSSSISNYSGSIYYLGGFSLTAPNITQTRPFVSANADYWVEKNQRVSLCAYYNKQSLNSSNGITTMLTYTIGL